MEDTYEDVEVPKEDDRYTALSALTADKKDNSSQYTALIKTPSQTVQRSDNQSRDIPLATTLPSVHKSDQKVKNSAEIEPYDYVSFEISGSQTKSRNSDSAALAQTALAQNQEAIYY